jgi:BASS family bile acid:Na+ symporter
MESSLVTNLLLPLALGVVMLGLGLSLTTDDFKRIARYPKAVLIGLATQTIVLVAIAYALTQWFDLSPELSVGLMLLAASPGGATANIYSHLAKGDVALNITLTAINSALALITLPLIVNFSLAHFMGQEQYVPPPTRKIVEVAVIIVLPVLIGMAGEADPDLRRVSAARSDSGGDRCRVGSATGVHCCGRRRLSCVQLGQYRGRLRVASIAETGAQSVHCYLYGDRHPQRHACDLHCA